MEQKARMTAKDPAIKVAHQRLSVLQLAEMLGNVSVACKQMGMDRTSFYEWKRRFQTHGLEGLKDMPPIHLSHPQTTSPGNRRRNYRRQFGSSFVGLCPIVWIAKAQGDLREFSNNPENPDQT